MKKIILTLTASAIMAFAGDTTVTATMSLMEKGMNEIQKGFLYNDKTLIKEGIEIVRDANSIFSKVDVRSFLNNDKTQVVANITDDLKGNLKKLSSLIGTKKYSDASRLYGKVVNDCVACHTIIRRW